MPPERTGPAWLGGMGDESGPVIGVIGGCGGVGASSFAAVLAAVASRDRPSVLLDLDPIAGGIDVLLGAEQVPGPRWSGLHLGGGDLDPQLLADGLPRWSSVAFLAADSPPVAAAVAQFMSVARRLGVVSVDLGRWDSEARQIAVAACDLIVLVTRADVPAVTAARAVVANLGGGPLGVVVRTGPGAPASRQVADLLGVPLIGTLPALRGARDEPLDADTVSRAERRVARGVLDGLGRHA
jgi:secretion/DNA translocation related CpaE-like protein